MTSDERDELQRDAESLAYTNLNFTGLWRELTGPERDALAKSHGQQVVELLERLVDERFTQIESVTRSDERHLANY